MSTKVAATNRLIASRREAELADGVLDQLATPDGFLLVGVDGKSAPTPLPREVGLLLQEVLQAVARGDSVTVSSLPDELTTSTAAAVLGVSRPTLMKLIADGSLAAHKVGTHTRVSADDVLAARRARRARERAAFEKLLEVEGIDDV